MLLLIFITVVSCKEIWKGNAKRELELCTKIPGSSWFYMHLQNTTAETGINHGI